LAGVWIIQGWDVATYEYVEGVIAAATEDDARVRATSSGVGGVVVRPYAPADTGNEALLPLSTVRTPAPA